MTPSQQSLPESDSRDLLARLRAAEEAVRARDDFLAIAAHELRSPLNAMALRLAALERIAARNGDPVLQDGLQRAGRSVQRYVDRALVLLDLSRLQAGPAAPACRPVRAADVVREVVDAHREEAEFHGARLQSVMPEEEVVGSWDPHMVEQILSNLVSNAIKYGGGTPVQVRAGLAAPGLAFFEVSDRGPGIAPEDRRRIFEKFERVVSTSRDRSGFGLGLWIVGRMVAAHHGSIEVAQAPGGGALFRVLLPLHAPPPPHREEQNN